MKEVGKRAKQKEDDIHGGRIDNTYRAGQGKIK